MRRSILIRPQRLVLTSDLFKILKVDKMAEEKKSNRLMSLDALRGFDMFFITGGSALVAALCAAFGCGDCWLAGQMKHVPWAGLAQHDTIFPLFLFLAGVSWPFSLASQEAKGRTAWQIHRKVILRAFALFAIEICLSGFLKFKPDFRLMGVLSFIGLSWGVAAILFMHIRRFSKRVALVAALLVGYWALLRFGIAPDAPTGADSFSKEWNLVSWLDRTIWPTHLHVKGVYEPESFFSVTNGAMLAFLGMCAGALLKANEIAAARKVLILAVGGVAGLALVGLFTLVLGDQIVKALWTTSFVLSAAAYSSLMLALFYWLVDVKCWRKWTFFFRVIGMNSITIYVLMWIVDFGRISRYFLSGVAALGDAHWSALVFALGRVAAEWLVLLYLYRKQTFLRV